MRKNFFSLITLLSLFLFSSTIYAQTDLTGATVTLSSTEFTYDGTAHEPTVSGIRKGSKRYNGLVAGTDYDLTYSDNVHAGTATATLTFKGDYTGVATRAFTIAPKDLSREVALELNISEVDYDGTAKEPSVSDLKYGEITLISGTDYDISYMNNINPGSATVTATFKGDYTGTTNKKFTIIDSGTVPPSSLTVNYYDRNLENPEVEVEKTYAEFLTLLETYPNAIAIAPRGFDVWPMDKKHIVVRGENEWTNTCNSFTLTDKQDFYSSVSFTAKTVTYTRNLVEGYNTICLPFGIGEADIPENSGLYNFFTTDEENNQIYFLATQAVSAGYPCLLKTEQADPWTLELSDIRIENRPTGIGGANEGASFGTYVLTSAFKYDENNPFYGLRNSDNKFAPLANTLSPFRACIQIHDINVSTSRSAYGIVIADSITDIENVKAQAKDSKTLLNGKFVNNGQIIIVKDGKTFNISGAELK